MKKTLLALLAFAAMAQESVVSVDKWKVRVGDDPRWAAPDFDDRDWRTDRIPGSRLDGFRWYRTTLVIPPAWKDQPLALAFGPMGEAFEVYVDGVRIGGLGVLDPVPVSAFVRHLSLRLPPASGGAGAPLHIAVRRWMGQGTPYFLTMQLAGSGLLAHAPELGRVSLAETRESLHALQAWGSMGVTHGLILLSALTGILALILFAQRTDRREYLWLGLSLVLQAVPLVAIPMAVRFDLPVRSIIPALAVAMGWLPGILSLLFLREICPRLRGPLAVCAVLLSWFPPYCFLAIHLDRHFDFNVLPVYAAITSLAPAAAAILLWFERRKYGFALTASLLLVPLTWLAVGLSLPYPILALITSVRRREVMGFLVDPVDVASALFTVTILAVIYLRSRDEQREQRARDEDLAAGRRVQHFLLESDAAGTPGFQVEKAYLPAREVGGDFYQLIPRPDGGLLAVVGDVSGKGLEAAMMGARLLGALETLTDRPPGEVLRHLNETLRRRSRGGFVTCCCALFSPDGSVMIANAGHPSPYGDGRELAVPPGLPLGIAADVEYEDSIARAERVTFLSDGVVEAENAQRELFGFERTREISVKSAREIAEAAKAWGQNDDITVVTVRRNG